MPKIEITSLYQDFSSLVIYRDLRSEVFQPYMSKVYNVYSNHRKGHTPRVTLMVRPPFDQNLR